MRLVAVQAALPLLLGACVSSRSPREDGGAPLDVGVQADGVRDGIAPDLRRVDLHPDDGRNDGATDLRTTADSADDADSPPTTFRISAALTTDPTRGEFETLEDFATLGPACFDGGEQILLASGQTFSGRLVLAACAGASGAVSVSTYGGTTRARINGTTSIAALGLSWQLESDPRFNGESIEYLQGTPLYRVGPVTGLVQQLYSGLERMTLARHPNGTARDPQYFRATAFWDYSPTGCQAAACIRGDDQENSTWALRTFGLGPRAFAVIRTSNWSLQRSEIVWFNPSENGFAIKDSLRTPITGDRMPEPDFGFILLNTLPLIDRAGEWYYHPDEQMLYLWSPDGAKPVEAQTHVNFTTDGPLIAASFSGTALDLTVTDLIIERSPAAGIQINGGRNLTVERVRVDQPETHGIVAWGQSGSLRIDDCVVRQPAGNGMHVGQVGDEIRVTGSQVVDPGGVFNQPDLGMNFNGIRTALQARLTITGNDVRNAGYAGAMIAPATVSLAIEDNTVDGYCLLLNDCGGIYFNGMTNTLQNSQTVAGNAFSGSVGNTSGVPPGRPPLAAGVYLDHGASHFTVADNQVDQSHSHIGGIFLHGGTANVVSGNSVSATLGPAFGMRKIEPGFPAMDSNNVRLNSFTTSSSAHAVIRLVDPSDRDCADMQPAIGADNTLTHTTVPGWLYMCQ